MPYRLSATRELFISCSLALTTWTNALLPTIFIWLVVCDSNGLTHTFPGTDSISVWISNASRKSSVCGSTKKVLECAARDAKNLQKCKDLKKNQPNSRKAENVAFWHVFSCKNPRLLSVDISTFSPHFRQLQWCDCLVNKNSSYHLLLLAVASTQTIQKSLSVNIPKGGQVWGGLGSPLQAFVCFLYTDLRAQIPVKSWGKRYFSMSQLSCEVSLHQTFQHGERRSQIIQTDPPVPDEVGC